MWLSHLLTSNVYLWQSYSQLKRTTYTVLKCHPVGLISSKYLSILADIFVKGHILGN
jgi:hypothetical protein